MVKKSLFSRRRLNFLSWGLLGNSCESPCSDGPLAAATGLLSQLEVFISHLVRSGDQVLETQPRLLELGRQFIQPVAEMSALQELRLVEMMSSFFQQDRDDATRQLIFSTLFNVDVKDQQAETRRRSLFGKLVSLSLVLDRTAVSECAATWLQGMDREVHLQLGQVLLDDYVPGLVSVLQNIRRASRRFCCQFITVVAARYDLSSEELTPPLELVHMFVSWIRDDPGLVLLTLRSTPLSSSQPISTLHVTPLEGLMCWCVKAPLVYRSTTGDGENEGNTDLLFSALHLSCLEIIQLLPNILAEKGVLGHVPLIQLGSMAALTSDLSKLLQRAENVGSPDCGLSLERLAQGLQLARVCRVLLCCREELRAVCRRLPHNTLLQLVMTGPVMKDSGVDNTDSEAAGLTEGGVDPPLPPAGEEQVVPEGEPSVPGIADL